MIKKELTIKDIELELSKHPSIQDILKRFQCLTNKDAEEWLNSLIKLKFTGTAYNNIAIEYYCSIARVKIGVYNRETGKLDVLSFRMDYFLPLLTSGRIFKLNESTKEYIHELDALLTSIDNFNETFNEDVYWRIPWIIYRLYHVLSFPKYQYLYKNGYINLDVLETKFDLPKDKVTDIVKSSVTKSFELNESETAIRIKDNV